MKVNPSPLVQLLDGGNYESECETESTSKAVIGTEEENGSCSCVKRTTANSAG